MNDNPQYTYAYQVAAEDEQTYIAHQEQRDGDDVSISLKNLTVNFRFRRLDSDS